MPILKTRSFPTPVPTVFILETELTVLPTLAWSLAKRAISSTASRVVVSRENVAIIVLASRVIEELTIRIYGVTSKSSLV